MKVVKMELYGCCLFQGEEEPKDGLIPSSWRLVGFIPGHDGQGWSLAELNKIPGNWSWMVIFNGDEGVLFKRGSL